MIWLDSAGLRLCITLIFSALVHVGLFWELTQQVTPERATHRPRSYSLIVVLSPITQSLSASAAPSNLALQDSTSSLNKAKQQKVVAANSQVFKQASPNANDETPKRDDDLPLNQYYSSKDIERRALPIGNIDISMLGDILVDGMPLRMRLYINAEGKIKKIERLAVLEQDEALAKKLESLLLDMTFIPAKKQGQDVSAYQDIEFSFQPMMSAMPNASVTP